MAVLTDNKITSELASALQASVTIAQILKLEISSVILLVIYHVAEGDDNHVAQGRKIVSTKEQFGVFWADNYSAN